MAAVSSMVFILISKTHNTIVAHFITTRLFWINQLTNTVANNMEL
jgi:hypothetical protein